MTRSSSSNYQSNVLPAASEELDMFTILTQLWQGKKTLLISIVACLAAAVIFIFLANPKWTSSAIITQPTMGQMSNINEVTGALFLQKSKQGLTMPNMQEKIFSRYKESLSSLSETLNNQKPSLHLNIKELDPNAMTLQVSFSALTPELAQKQLNHYLSLVNINTVDFFKNDLLTSVKSERASLENSLSAQHIVAQTRKDQQIEKLKQSLIIAEAANIKEPKIQQSETLPDESLFLLGSDALNAMITHDQSMPLVFNEDYYKTQQNLITLNTTKIQLDNMQVFSYISKADQPQEKDFPKPVLTVFLALIIGLIGGSTIVMIRSHFKK